MKTVLFIILAIIHASIFSQENLKGIVYYGHQQSFGIGAPIGVDYTAELTFNSNSTSYTFAKDSLEGGHINQMKYVKTENKTNFIIHKNTTKEGYTYNINRRENIMRTRDIGFNYVKDTIPNINWKILDETKKIGKLDCTKATCSFKGRDYTAWFSTSIPLPYGPWKLQGLPGLILEAYDTDKEIYFYFKSIEYPSKKDLKITIPNPETNMDMERNRPTKEREWITSEDFKKEMIKRHRIGTKMGRMFNEQAPIVRSGNSTNPMRNVYIEIFDEE
tara:strand:+ start:89282 stop:90106 length:825 start_codon:yes stop_codon:yes gene_type:complete